MILTWTPQFIQTALDTLTDEQRAAIHLAADLNGTPRPGPARLKKFGFDSADQYSMVLEAARSRLKNWFAVWGVRKISDIDFEPKGCSAEGRIQKNAGSTKAR